MESGDEELLPLTDLIGTYPQNNKNNRHPLKYIIDSTAAKDALHMYQHVYSGSQPDNCEFGTKFIRGLVLFSEPKENANLAVRAAELAVDHAKTLQKNPLKLVPPCIREQIQSMIDTFTFYLAQAYKAQNSDVKKRKMESLEGDSTLQSALNKEELDIKPMLPPARGKKVGSTNIVQQKRSALTAQKTMAQLGYKSAAVALAIPTESIQALTPLDSLLKKHVSAEGRLIRQRSRLESLESGLSNSNNNYTQHRALENRLWDDHTALRTQIKEAIAACKHDEKTHLEAEAKRIATAATRATEVLEADQKIIAKCQGEIELCLEHVDDLQDDIGQLSEQIEVLTIENSSLRPQPFSGLLPEQRYEPALEIHLAKSCPYCNCFFVHCTFVALNCGCLLHLHCMFKLVLGSRVFCLRCETPPTTTWLAQWGITSVLESTPIAHIPDSMTSLAW